MKKAILIALIVLSGCSSTDWQQKVENLEQEVQSLRELSASNKKNIASQNIQLQYLQTAPVNDHGDDTYEKARIKNQIKVLDETFSRDLLFFREKLYEAEKRIEEQASRIEELENYQTR